MNSLELEMANRSSEETTSVTPALQPIRPAFHLQILSEEQLSQLKSATLEILAETGVHCPSEKALKIYAEHDARVDYDRKIVRLPPEVVIRAMAHAPRSYTLGARLPAFDLNPGWKLHVLRHGRLRCGNDRLCNPPAAPIL